MSNKNFFTDKTYARGDEAYVNAAFALTAAQQASADATAAITAVQAFDPDGLNTTWYQPEAPTTANNGDLWMDSNDGNHLYRLVSKYGTSSHTNYCPTPNGQNGTGSWAAVRGSLAGDGTVLYDKQASLRSVISDVSVKGNLSQELNLVVVASPATDYVCSAYLRSTAGSGIVTYRARVSYRNGSNTVLATTSADAVATAADAWVRLVVTSTAPAGTTNALLEFGPAVGTEIDAGDAYFLNGVMWETGTTVNPAIAGGLDGCSWSGTPGASSTVYTPGWIDVQDQSIGSAILAAAGAQATADGKIRTFAQTTAPAMTAGQDIGDLWMDTDDNNKLYRWNGTTWALLADARIDNSVTTFVTEYAVNSSETVAPTTGWSTATPTRTPGTFIWYRVTVTRVDGSNSTTSPALLTGNTGATGSQGIQGPPGTNGVSLYTWLKYADTPTTGMSDDPTGKTYMGLAFNKSSSTESNVYSDYSWSLIKGTDGVPGAPGADGTTTYTWVKYGDSPTTGMSDDPTGKLYIGLAFNKTTATESTNYADYQWALIKGSDGSNGTNGISVTGVIPYYQTVTTGSAAPAAPTTNPPGGSWTTTEPSYAANTELYRTELVTFSNSTFTYTAVTKVSSYAAAVAAMAAATTAQTTANGKNKVTYSTSVPGTTANAAGDIWFQLSGTQVIGQWSGQGGTSWTQVTLNNSVIATLDAAKITSGYLDVANRVKAGSISTEMLGVGVLRTNLVADPSFEEDYTFGAFVDGGAPGNTAQWRTVGTGSGSRYVGDGRSGATSAHIMGTVGADMALVSNSFQVESGKTYRILAHGVPLVSDTHVTFAVITGSTSENISASTGTNPTIVGVGDTYGALVTAQASVTPTNYQGYAAEFTPTVNAWAAIKVINSNPSTTGSILVIDDVSVVESGAGGASELTAAGLRLFNNDGEEIGAFVSNRPNYFSVESNGATLAAITDSGQGYLTGLAVGSDPTVSGQPLVGLQGNKTNTVTLDTQYVTRDLTQYPIGIVESMPKGIIAMGHVDDMQASFNDTIAGGTKLGTMQLNALLEDGREYIVSTSPLLMTYGTSINLAEHYLLYTTDGSDPNLTSSRICWATGFPGSQNSLVTLPGLYRRIRGTSFQHDIRFLHVIESNGSMVLNTQPVEFSISVEDMGLVPDNSQIVRNLTSGSPPASKKSYTTIWNATDSESYGAFGARPEADLYHGYYSSTQGNQFAHILFNGTGYGTYGQAVSLSTAMSGATITNVQLRLTNRHFYYNAGGQVYIRPSVSTALSGSPNGATGVYKSMGDGATAWLDITSIFTTSTRSISLGRPLSTALTYYGYFANHSSGSPPVLQIQYTK